MNAPTPQARPTKDRPSLAQLGSARPRLRSVAVAPLLTAVPAAVAVGAAVGLAPDQARVTLGWSLGAAALLLCAAVAVAAHAVQTSRSLLHRLETVSRDAGRLLQEKAALAEESVRERTRLTDEFTRDRARLAEQNAHQKVRLAAELDRERIRLGAENARVTEELRRARTDRATAISAAAHTAGRLQALSTGMLADLRAMEERHADEDVLADLLHLDHRTAQAGRLADVIAVLTGARSGRRWARPIVMESVLRGAMGRIGAYRRVRVHSASEAAVAGHAAEGVMHALAELLDNAANFSPPTAEVHVYVEEVPAGVIVSVEDSGLVMGEAQLRRAERAVSGTEPETGGLAGTRLGLTVVGRLARKYGLTVSFRPSARGGTGALLLIPQDILATPPQNAMQNVSQSSPWNAAQNPAQDPARHTERNATHHPFQAASPTSPSPASPPPAPAAPPPVRAPEPEPDTAAAPGTAPGMASDAAVREAASPFPGPRPGPWSASQGSYAASHALPDLDPEPVPAHGFRPPPPPPPPSATGHAELLPRRHRGRMLAEAEAEAETLAQTRAQAQAKAETRGEAARTRGPAPDDVRGHATRFNSFRQAVRRPAADEPVQAPPSPATPHPEGDPTS
ncbi:signal transduction histidine kinase [Streptomyces sp. V3I8]|uniref:sensor histidine kinase n=1 Tax=Streptomyces sp. V3I8 TaxID=3042279 RepID=UPI002780BD8A|nr:ATP-binding protein [Streptomyces sp. V3I8]MDQ1037000.1 signal transduction histidine kinase [Streptomyces sp. V3I8]